ncbi:hypothetical protein L0P54_07305 [Anaerosalibacter bizertensis]|uniref:Uncharacterized protein n=2 Tax=Anaerosalibacter bizertensis TaxID=932217 RepID=A0A9Q4ADN2_9FIRM|nr:hypothetical protein [Anaerosalibacter bizertensis]MBV1818905.1 hypothetical protein [Bacteroidales bacterium MSK.15.36]MCB5559865.1 hypothetical protein [Anaerosalibacter bizertensis]MCG4565706.1 hypothetical protein [Anaerosalibacter bizertensis]MCG4582791.1 hypothetical protein [Anaerosalibacter bizertensis]MCG4585089.1 hypothetical protein [Anaerosalibacter bizertensis]
MSLLKLIRGKYETVSIVGMAKNTGKTMTLNHLIGEAIDESVVVGITSIGRDGESLDLVTETEKPKIFVEEGTLVATTSDMLLLGDAKVEIISVTDYRTPLGSIIIGRVKDSGYVQIGGPQTVKETKEVANIMLELGAEFVIIDGALDRISSAAPSVSEGTILSTGATLSRNMNKVIEETLHVVNLLKLPEVKDEKARPLIEEIVESGKVCLINEDYEIEPLKVRTALSCGNIIGDHISEDTKYVVVSGSLVKNTIEDMIKTTRKYKNVKIIISDGTKVFIKPKDWLRFQRYGVKVEVLNSIELVAITTNPYAPQGYYFDPREFLEKMKGYVKEVPVIDVVLGGE